MNRWKAYGKVLAGFIILFVLSAIVPMICSAETGKRVEFPKTRIEVLRIGTIPAESVYIRRERYKGLVDHLKKKLAVDIELFTATDYTGVIEAMRAG